ncbi:MAG: hypothetical protein ABL878_16755 [Burkholderiales bacterium]
MRSAIAWTISIVLAACGGGGVETYRTTAVDVEPEPSIPGPANPSGATAAGLYTNGGDGDANVSSSATFKFLIIDSGRVYALATDSKGAMESLYLGSGVEGPLMASQHFLSFVSPGLRGWQILESGDVPPIRTVTLDSYIFPRQLIFNGALAGDGAKVSFGATYKSQFNDIGPSISNVAPAVAAKYRGMLAVGFWKAPGHRGGLAIRLDNIGKESAILTLEDGCNNHSGILTPHPRGNSYDVSFKYKLGSCGGEETFTGHAIVENDARNQPHITLMAANSKLTQVLGFVGSIDTATIPETP